MLKAILFDVDGTLLDTENFIYKAVEHTLKTYGFNAPARHVMRSLMGLSLKNFYGIVEPIGDSELFHKTHTAYQKENIKLCHAFPGVVETLEKLKKKGLKLALVTSRHQDTLEDSLKHTQIYDFFDVMISADDVKAHKPDPEGIIRALKILGLDPQDVVYVGDTKYDVQAGRTAGVETVAVTYGFGENLEKESPNHLIDHFPDLLKVLPA